MLSLGRVGVLFAKLAPIIGALREQHQLEGPARRKRSGTHEWDCSWLQVAAGADHPEGAPGRNSSQLQQEAELAALHAQLDSAHRELHTAQVRACGASWRMCMSGKVMGVHAPPCLEAAFMACFVLEGRNTHSNAVLLSKPCCACCNCRPRHARLMQRLPRCASS